jgi:ketosteroid isomerase-like protein
MSRTNLELVRSFYEEMAAGNFWALAPYLDDEIEWSWAPQFRAIAGDAVIRGPEAVARATLEIFEVWPRYTLEAEEFIETGDSVVVLSVGRAQLKGSDAELENRGAEIWTLRGGRVIRMRAFLDRAEAMQAAGLSP